MSKNRAMLTLYNFILCAYLVTAVNLAFAGDLTSTRDITLELEINRTTYVVGEPIELSAILRNDGDSDNRIGRSFDVSKGNLNFTISLDGINYKRYLGPHGGINDSYGGPLLQAKSTMKQAIRILHNTPRSSDWGELSHIAFPVEGQAFLKAKMRFRDSESGFLESNVLKLNIQSPEGVDAQLLEVLKSRKSVYFLHTAKLTKSDNIKNYTDLVEQYPDSVYAKILTNTITDYHERRAKKQNGMRNGLNGNWKKRPNENNMN